MRACQGQTLRPRAATPSIERPPRVGFQDPHGLLLNLPSSFKLHHPLSAFGGLAPHALSRQERARVRPMREAPALADKERGFALRIRIAPHCVGRTAEQPCRRPGFGRLGVGRPKRPGDRTVIQSQRRPPSFGASTIATFRRVLQFLGNFIIPRQIVNAQARLLFRRPSQGNTNSGFHKRLISKIVLLCRPPAIIPRLVNPGVSGHGFLAGASERRSSRRMSDGLDREPRAVVRRHDREIALSVGLAGQVEDRRVGPVRQRPRAIRARLRAEQR